MKFRTVWALALLLCIAALCLVSCGKNEYPEIGAKQFLEEILKRGELTVPNAVSGNGEAVFDANFTAWYGEGDVSAEMYRDAACAYCTDILADEISLFVLSDTKYQNAVETALAEHVEREVSVYEKYSAEDTAKLQNARIYTYGKYLFLVVSANPSSIRDVIEEILKNPPSVPVIGSVTETESATDRSDSTDDPSGYDYAKPVPASPAVDETEWMSRSVLIGDSRLYGLYYYLHPAVKASYAYEALSINGIFTKELVETKNGKIKISDALRADPDFDRVYIMFGINEMSWIRGTYSYYRQLIDLIREVNPNAQIYILGMYPVEESKVKAYQEYITNANIQSANADLLALAAEKKVYFVDTFSLLAENGGLPEDSTNDGIHVGKKLCRKLMEGILTHTVSAR